MKSLRGDEIIARALEELEFDFITGHPGSPVTGVAEILMERGLNAEWAVNELSAVETALGASFSGLRSAVVLKHVGMNHIVDPIMCANLTGINAALLIIVGDDPGATRSQNEQDSRVLASFMELPVLEPSSHERAPELLRKATWLSEELRLPVVFRVTADFCYSSGEYRKAERVEKRLLEERRRWISTMENVERNHRRLHDKLREASKIFDEWIEIPEAQKELIIASGFVATKLREQSLALETLHPLPSSLADKLQKFERILVLEEVEPFVERALRAEMHLKGYRTRIFGKDTQNVKIGRLREEDVRRAIESFREGNVFEVSEERREPAGLCEGCPYADISEILGRFKGRIFIAGDSGCSVRLRARPHELLDAKLNMGSSAGIARGFSLRGDKAVAIMGDSAFFHSGIYGVLDAVLSNSNILLIIVDNEAAAMSGFQKTPNARGVSIERILEALGAKNVHGVHEKEELERILERVLEENGFHALVYHRRCPEDKYK
ncbi:MAG: indolepyruvate ferredoxin oxidoreductase subunit alpha, partial [Archaeoglobi archaeon]|nr:indolepyruvate ferredoxin oxidoreductase subunit alpha [Candidatus Mnemosynella bozhongmuii]